MIRCLECLNNLHSVAVSRWTFTSTPVTNIIWTFQNSLYRESYSVKGRNSTSLRTSVYFWKITNTWWDSSIRKIVSKCNPTYRKRRSKKSFRMPSLYSMSGNLINSIYLIFSILLQKLISPSKFHIDLEYNFVDKKWFSTQIWGFIDRLCHIGYVDYKTT